MSLREMALCIDHASRTKAHKLNAQSGSINEDHHSHTLHLPKNLPWLRVGTELAQERSNAFVTLLSSRIDRDQ
jgi:hypothetical protein